VRPAVASGNVDLLTDAFATRVLTTTDGRLATGIEVRHAGATQIISAGKVVLAAGSVNTAALLLRSASDAHPSGLANTSGQVGRNYMIHNNSIMLAVRPLQRNRDVFHKTLYINDFYLRGTSAHPYPLGHIQVIGKLRKEMLAGQRPPSPAWVRGYLAERSLTWWLFTEDLPRESNRVTLGASGRIRVDWTPNNVRAHEVLVQESRKVARASGFPITFVRRAGVDVSAHQSGTARMGFDPADSVVDQHCRSHEVPNLFMADASVFPSLPVMNPALTIMANALRVGGLLRQDM
jgi:choline dehydrogenase-like flavoprotein